MKINLKITIAWFIKDYLQHNLELIAKARKKIPTQKDKETILTDETDFSWDLERYHNFFNIPNVISSAAIETISVDKDYVRVTPVTTYTTPLY